ncbi:hypothetical protein MRQ36_01645 [Micromonospora sp. R77]|uniref:hypothetical protein n=1 Tax=Micromonospora sp. R77 TaxID=2925836 RepID=UPI001F617D09|nr:hypothetical protein [Micromonospora sp. R77]MCI4061344.1 hypothetical protein [Micromonospora sp. R77]
MADATDTLRFALRQGPLRGILHDPIVIDESVPTTALLPPAAARGVRGRPLPPGTTAALAAAAYPAGRLPAGPVSWERLGTVLLAAFGLQRREPSNPANDHRVTASVRSKFPVHVFVVPPAGPAGYLDVYRHALVDVPDVSVPPPLRPGPGEVTVVLAARHTDLPAPYGALRCALTDLETGINLRSLLVAAELAGLGAVAATDGPTVTSAADLVGATGRAAGRHRSPRCCATRVRCRNRSTCPPPRSPMTGCRPRRPTVPSPTWRPWSATAWPGPRPPARPRPPGPPRLASPSCRRARC